MIISLGELNLQIEKNKTVVLCHGVFDILHAGHIHHFQEAKKYGNTLVVSITPDQYVNKGPNRPIFNQNVRARVVDALEVVDLVVVNYRPDALDVLEILKPDIFCKGSEVLNCPSKHIQIEKECVESYGGELVFLDMLGDDSPVSSSKVINKFLPERSAQLSGTIEATKSLVSYADLGEHFDRIKDLNILIVGEFISDEYLICDPLARSSKEMLVPMHFDHKKVFLGGSGIVAANLAQFCDNVTLLTFCDVADGLLIRLKTKGKVSLLRCDHQTIRKVRQVERGTKQKVAELVYLKRNISSECAEQLETHLAEKIPNVDLIICTDYGHGLFLPDIIDQIVGSGKFLALNVQTNAANYGYNLITKWPAADYGVVDEKELRLACVNQNGPLDDLIDQMDYETDIGMFAVTLGHQGSVIYPSCESPVVIPPVSARVVDTMGAGDAFLAITAPFVFLGLPPVVFGLIGNAFAAMKVGLFGNVPVPVIEFKKFIKSLWA